MKIKIEGVKENIFGVKEIGIRLPGMKKTRWCVVMPMEDDNGEVIYIIQGNKFIMQVDPKRNVVVYNTKCEYFLCLNPIMGANVAEVENFDELLEVIKEVALEKGQLIGVAPTENGPTEIYFGGGKLI